MTLEPACAVLDGLRAGVLRFTLRSAGLRRIFAHRAARLGWLFCAAFLLSSALAVFAPVLTLLAGPIVYGYPHVLISLRFFPRLAGAPRSPNARYLLLLGGGLILLCAGLHHTASVSEWTNGGGVERLATLAAFAAAALLTGRNRPGSAAAWIVLGAAALIAGRHTAWTVAALILLHNGVSFLIWMQQARPGVERQVAAAATAVFVATSVAILAGAADAWVNGEGLAGYTLDDFIALFTPAMSAEAARRAAIAYAFGQSMHYFVWFQAIPDSAQGERQTPTSFRETLKNLRREFTPQGAAVLLATTAALSATWLFVTVREARVLYFSFAALHGYLEIAALGASLIPVTQARYKTVRPTSVRDPLPDQAAPLAVRSFEITARVHIAEAVDADGPTAAAGALRPF